MRTAFVVLALLSALILAAPAAASWPGANGSIGLASGNWTYAGDDQPGISETTLATTGPLGGPRHVLRHCRTGDGPPQGQCDPVLGGEPEWAPDAGRVLVTGDNRLWDLGIDGSATRLPFVLSERFARDFQTPLTSVQVAAFSSGRRVVYTHIDSHGTQDLYVGDVASGKTRRLTYRGGLAPTWTSADRIVFVRVRDRNQFQTSGKRDLFTIRPNGTGLRRLTYRGGTEPDASPRGRFVAFLRGGRVYTVALAGGAAQRLPVTGPAASNPAWSPDGRLIAFDRGGHLVRARLDGRVRDLGAAANAGVSWAPAR